MQTCIERYQASRRLQTDLRTYFDEYMFLGGIKTFSAPFSGTEAEMAGHWSVSQNQSTDSQHVKFSGRFYDGEDENWAVDFSGVAAGFLSSILPTLTGSKAGTVERCISVVENFLRYVLYHSVCPEYTSDVKAALQVASDARAEWPMLEKLQESFPGQFNLAAAEIFKNHDADDWSFQRFVRPKDFNPQMVFYSTLALLDDADLIAKMTIRKPRVVSEIECSLILTEMIYPKKDVVQNFRRLKIGDQDNKARLSPVGKARFQPTTIEDGWYDPYINANLDAREEIVLYIETSILALMKVGMKFEMKLCRVNAGIHFLKSIIRVVPSFYIFLPQQLMRDFTPPQRVEHKKVLPQSGIDEAAEDEPAEE